MEDPSITISTPIAAKEVLHDAAMVTVVADRESDIYAEWARIPAPDFHLLTRAMQPRPEGSTAAQKNPHHLRSLAWASWVIAKLGGWDG